MVKSCYRDEGGIIESLEPSGDDLGVEVARGVESQSVVFKRAVRERGVEEEGGSASGRMDSVVAGGWLRLSRKVWIDRYVHSLGTVGAWDLYVPWVAMGYRVTPQESTRLSRLFFFFFQEEPFTVNHPDKDEGLRDREELRRGSKLEPQLGC